ncbi:MULTISPECIES: hypothetical protein [Roseivirga]|uniref:hypothetical protein n=1 Tax=Roseivirga TaxID=290180 RepID=UPI001671E10D|nr:MULTISPECIES: hypothetical protein [Roseivirga]MEC7754518.1 hypothetical protein [Bacteroidota bacterium]|tara:strand:- start:7177 stop:7728 length:552 start_codon:yes stop_codon:yes gene_type:complete
MKTTPLLHSMQHFILGMMIVAASLISQKTQAQNARISKDEMQKLSGWVGEWKGEGWQMDQQTRQKITFTVVEKVEQRLDGMALIVEGKGSSNGTLGHHAMAMVYYNADAGHYDFHSLVMQGHSTMAKGEFNDKGEFVWGFKVPQGEVRYVITIEGDTWTEKGAFSMDGSTWYPTMEMQLKRVK